VDVVSVRRSEEETSLVRKFTKMSLFFNTDDGVHIERLNAEQSRKRGIFINVQPSVDDNGKKHSEHQTPSFIHLRNNLNISPGERRREAFTKTPLKKVREIKQYLGNKEKTLLLHSYYANCK
jgi:hypothetical protein